MDADAVRARVSELFGLWNGGDLSRLADLYSVDFEADYRPYAPIRHGLEGIRAMLENARGSFPDYHEDMLDIICEEDRAAVRLRITFTHDAPWGPLPPTGKRVSYEELLMLTFRDGKVVAQRGIVDNLSVLRQLGVVSTPPGQSAARD
ncbi:MAG: ester cyclase [Dehalococcoidia bacterium]|nr:ester cyclase [Dehalococcoidia bacterium]MCB9485411.1 ester cyclase [Thermoflexaceae bacterium]